MSNDRPSTITLYATISDYWPGNYWKTHCKVQT